MAKQPITMLQIRRIIQLLAQSQSKRKISRLLHASRHTIDDYALKIEQTGLSLSALSKLSDAELAALLYTANRYSVHDQRFDDLKERLDYFLKE
jgi:transposase